LIAKFVLSFAGVTIVHWNVWQIKNKGTTQKN